MGSTQAKDLFVDSSVAGKNYKAGLEAMTEQTLIANGIMTFIDKKTKYHDFFDYDEMGFYTDADDLLNQLEKLNGDINKINRISKKGKIRYFSIFDNTIVADFIISKTFDTKNKYKYIWD